MGGSFSLPFPLASVSSSSLSTLLFLSSASFCQCCCHYQIRNHHPLASFPAVLLWLLFQHICSRFATDSKSQNILHKPSINRRPRSSFVLSCLLSFQQALALAFTDTVKKRVQTMLTLQVTSVDKSKGQVSSVNKE